MISNRSILGIYVDTLTEIKNDTGIPTRITYGAYLNCKTTKKILTNLTAQGLINEHQTENDKRTKNSYTITKKGNNALDYLNKVTKLLE